MQLTTFLSAALAVATLTKAAAIPLPSTPKVDPGPLLNILLEVANLLSPNNPSIAANKPPKAEDFSRSTLIGTNDFPDPAFIKTTKGDFYAFSTNRRGKNVPTMHSPDFNTWTTLTTDALPLAKVPSWVNAAKPKIWAPDVVQLKNGMYIMYYSASTAIDPRMHCVGAASSTNAQGPYAPIDDQPLVCPATEGGAIDASGFQDPATGKQYVIYKVDANGIGSGGSCGNSFPGTVAHPKRSTPIRIQEVSAEDGITPIGDAVQILDRAADEPYVEAPSMVAQADPIGKEGYIYYLFYSSGCFVDDTYDVEYATSINGVMNGGQAGGKSRADYGERKVLMKSGDGHGLWAPGGMDVGPRGINVMYMSDEVRGSTSSRQPRKGRLRIDGRTVSVTS
jgi:hypothetical protein